MAARIVSAALRTSVGTLTTLSSTLAAVRPAEQRSPTPDGEPWPEWDQSSRDELLFLNCLVDGECRLDALGGGDDDELRIAGGVAGDEDPLDIGVARAARCPRFLVC